MNPKGFIGLPALFAILLVLLAAAGGTAYYLQHQTPPQPQVPIYQPASTAPTIQTTETQVTTTKTYTNTQYSFSLQYPANVQVDTTQQALAWYAAGIQAGIQLVSFGKISGTNGYVSGSLAVGISIDPTDVTNCMTAPSSEMNPPSNVAEATINGVTFLSYELYQPAAGQFGSTKTYKTLKGNTCYSLFTVVTGEESNHLGQPEASLDDADNVQVSAALDVIARSFKFTTSPTQSQSISVPIMGQYTNTQFGFGLDVPIGSTGTDTLGYYSERSHFISIQYGNYYVSIHINDPVEGTMGQNDVAPSVSTSTVSVAGLPATKSLETFSATQSTELTLTFMHNQDLYYLMFPYTTVTDKLLSDKMIASLHFF